MEKLPIYKLVIKDNDDSGVDFVALVDSPAIGINWVAFENQEPMKFAITNEAQHIISGPLMIPDLPIYRRADDRRPEHYVVFDVATIKQACLKFFRNGFTSNVNLMHEDDAKVGGVYMFESFIIDSDRGINTPAKFSLPQGTWFASYKVDNQDIWGAFIETGEFKGFSVEGLFDYSIPTGSVNMRSEIDIWRDVFEF